METRTHDGLLALHLSRVAGWLVVAVGRALAVGALVALVAGRLTGWRLVGVAVGVMGAGVALMLSGAPIPRDPDTP
jgi:hypothetical protein